MKYLITILLTIYGTALNAQELTAHYDPELKVHISLPAGWNTVNIYKPKIEPIIFLSYNERKGGLRTCGYRHHVRLAVYDSVRSQEIKKLLASISANPYAYIKSDATCDNVHGSPVRTKLRMVTYAYRHNGKIYLLECKTLKRRFKRTLPLFFNIANSVRFD